MKKLLLTAVVASVLALTAGAQKNPDALYLIGNMNNWELPTEEYVMYPDSTGLYSGTFFIGAGELVFKVYTVNETNWDNHQLYFGTNVSKPLYSNMDATMPMGHDLDYNFNCTNWYGGEVTISADLTQGVLTMSAPSQPEFYEADEVYLVGNMNGWTTPNDVSYSDTYVLHRDSTSSVSPMMYAGEFDIPAGDLQFKLFTKRVGWDDNSYYMGALGDFKIYGNEPATIDVSSTYNNNISCSNWQGGKAKISLDLYNSVLTIAGPDQPLKPLVPDFIYLIGSPQSWDINSSLMTLMPVNDSGIFKGKFHIPEGSAMFRFYTQLGNWEEGSLGIAVDDCPVDVFFESGYTSSFVNGKGSWNFINWGGGLMDITLDFNNQTVTFKDKEDVIYLVGSPQGWDINSNAMTLHKEEGTNATYKATFDIDADPFFRFYTELGDWDNNSIGSQIDDIPVDIEFNPATELILSATWGKGSWHIPGWTGGKITFAVDTEAMTVSLSKEMSDGLESAFADTFTIRKIGNSAMFGNEVRYSVVSTTGATVMRGKADSVDLSSLAKGVYVIRAIDNSGLERTAKVVR